MTTSRTTASALTVSSGETAGSDDNDPGASTLERTTSPPPWLDSFYNTHYSDLLRAGLYATGGRDLAIAEEAISVVFLRQIANGKWDHIHDRLNYFRKAVINQVKSEHRRLRAERDKAVNVTTENIDVADARSQDQMNFWEEDQSAQQLIDSLPPKQREVMRLVYETLKPREVAELMGGLKPTVRSNLAHARKKLEKCVPPQTHSLETETSAPAGEETKK